VTSLGTGRAPTAKFDLTLYAGEADGGIGLRLIYAADLFDAAADARAARPDRRPCCGRRSPTPTRASAPCAWRRTPRSTCSPTRAPLDATWRGAVHEIFAAQARRTPDALAVEDPQRAVDVRRAGRSLHRIARHLAAHGVRRRRGGDHRPPQRRPRPGAARGILKAAPPS
jgi:non-ribosomal peptide synthetase component F